ncbi:polymer-forming cytoskeletal protein [Methylocystis sp. ATCC 49242]|uniref:bactofilin family protein n=1 Tax=Methylocystis sp. ATCC 49242 TaxID=622637 RepID=UPI0001F87A35|nr:polymer-forming cytoskeletal protein [Methylocystis sp. ATCC 49242]
MMEFTPDTKNAVFLGEGVQITGEIHATGVVMIQGELNGEVNCGLLIVGESGVIDGVISATDAEISGSIRSDVTIKQLLSVRSTGRVEGNWNYGEIEIEKGGVLKGVAESTAFRSERAIPPSEGPLKLTRSRK